MSGNDNQTGGPTLSTHVLSLVGGCPARAIAIVLMAGEVGHETQLLAGTTNQDGRWPELAALTLAAGRYTLNFAVADYFVSQGVAIADPPFLDIVSLAFGMSDSGHYHVPLIASPFGYSTYRGS